MEMLEPLGRVAPAVLLLWLVVLTVILCTGAVGCCRALAFLHHQRRSQQRLINTLRIRYMLDRLGIGSHRYLCRESAPRIEIQLLRCHRCPRPEACDAYLNGDQAQSPQNFCPNYKELMALK
jgi:hypothetical protein